jgi:hypothetical protein
MRRIKWYGALEVKARAVNVEKLASEAKWRETGAILQARSTRDGFA